MVSASSDVKFRSSSSREKHCRGQREPVKYFAKHHYQRCSPPQRTWTPESLCCKQQLSSLRHPQTHRRGRRDSCAAGQKIAQGTLPSCFSGEVWASPPHRTKPHATFSLRPFRLPGMPPHRKLRFAPQLRVWARQINKPPAIPPRLCPTPCITRAERGGERQAPPTPRTVTRSSDSGCRRLR